MFKYIGKSILWLAGWKVTGKMPGIKKCVIIGAPHTSNWDFYIFIVVKWALEMPVQWMGKHTVFKPPMGWLARALGGIAVKRDDAKGLTESMIDTFNKQDKMALVIAVEGTRSYTEYWKSGFYRIALAADVPLVLGYLDFPNKTGGLSLPYDLTGDVDKDMAFIADFYAPFTGRHPEKESRIRLKMQDTEASE